MPTTSNISLDPQTINNFVDAAARRARFRQRSRWFYARIARSDFLDLTNVRFLVYVLMRQLANFRDQNVDLERQTRYLRSEYHRRTIRRHTSALRRQGLIERLGRNDWGMVANRRGRPVRMEFLYCISDPETALVGRFLLLLAFYPRSWRYLDVRAVQRLLGIRTEHAARLVAWIRSRRDSLRRRTIRAIVFEDCRPSWWNHRQGYRSAPDPDYTRFPIVRAAHPPHRNKDLLSNLHPGASPGGRRKPSKRPSRTFQAIVERFVSGAASSQDVDRIPGTDGIESLRSIVSQVPATPVSRSVGDRIPNYNDRRRGSDPPSQDPDPPAGSPTDYYAIKQALDPKIWGLYYLYAFVFPLLWGSFAGREYRSGPVNTISVFLFVKISPGRAHCVISTIQTRIPGPVFNVLSPHLLYWRDSHVA